MDAMANHSSYSLSFSDGHWLLEVLVGEKNLSIDLGPNEVRVHRDDGILSIALPAHAVLAVENCKTKLKAGRLAVKWPPVLENFEKECYVLKKCEQPLIFAAPNFVEKSVCVNLIRAAKMYGKAVPQFGHDVKYEMPQWPELHTEMDSDTARELESIYRRLDCLCGTERRCDEQLPRVHFQAPDMAKSRMPQGLHLDTNGAPHRYVTALIYLDTLPASGDGATTFPCAMAPEPVQRAGRELYNQGGQHTSNVSDELETLAQELLDASEEYCGFSALPEQGKLVIFFTRGDDGAVDPMSWHGGARVCAAGDFGGKWML